MFWNSQSFSIDSCFQKQTPLQRHDQLYTQTMSVLSLWPKHLLNLHSVSHFSFFLHPFSLSCLFFWWGGWGTKKNYILQMLPIKSHQLPFPITNEQSLSPQVGDSCAMHEGWRYKLKVNYICFFRMKRFVVFTSCFSVIIKEGIGMKNTSMVFSLMMTMIICSISNLAPVCH